MMHAWTADAWQSSWGIFSAENPDLGGKIGDINAMPDAASKKQLAGHRRSRTNAVHRSDTKRPRPAQSAGLGASGA